MNLGKKREFLELVTINTAKKIVQQNYSWIPSIEIKTLHQVKGRILSKDIIADIDTPPFDRSLMDGFAVRAEDTFEIEELRPRTFRIIETLQAGKISQKTLLQPFTAIEIATGASIPRGANAVVMVEYTSKISDEEVEIFRAVAPYENIDSAGSDIMYGETLLHEGDILTPVRLGILAALGIDKVEVYSKLNIGILSSGDEIRPPGDPLDPGCLYDSNLTVLSALVEDTGAITIPLGICPDDPEILKQTIMKHLDKLDILLISGGTSAGEGDYSYRVIKELGGELLFHGVSMKPGKPLAAGVVDGLLIFTLPGFPASTIFSFQTIISPLLHMWARKPIPSGKKLQAVIKQKIRSISGRTQFKLVHVTKEEKKYHAYPIKGASGSVSMLERADGYITIPESVEYLNPGDHVEVTLLREKFQLPDIIFIGSHDFVIDYLFQEFRKSHPECITRQNYTGSTGGFSAMSLGECDIAGVHLLDNETQKYNLTFLDKWKLIGNITLIKGYKRNQGLYVAKGNPKGVTGLEDLLRDDIKFLNRNEGSGTRILLDLKLKNLNPRASQTFQEIQQAIQGYNTVAYSHSATASAVARNMVDVSIGIEPYANLFGIEFILLAEEDYDFLVKNTSLEKPAIKKLMKLFYSEEFRRKVRSKIPKIKWFPTNKK